MPTKYLSTFLPGSATTAVILLVCGGGLGLNGCSNAPSRIAAPAWDPVAIADRAMSALDTDKNGQLSTDELKAAPGLRYNAKLIDTNGDGSLSREEIDARIKQYQEGRVGLTSFTCDVFLGNRPLEGAKVRLVPEPFLGEVIQPCESTTQKDGRVDFKVEGISMSVVPVGMYRVEITSPSMTIPAKYNVNTTLGVEVSAIADPDHPGPIEFHVKNS